MTSHPLDNPVYAALTGAHLNFALTARGSVRYPSDVSPFAAFATAPEPQDWADLAAIAGPATVVVLTGAHIGVPPADWEPLGRTPGVQLVYQGPDPEFDSGAVTLGTADVPEMLALVAATQPGPFETRTIELGTYLGVRHEGRLVAMAGERLHPPGHTEISAVCTAADFRGRGLSTRLVRSIAHQIRARGETPFLHAAASNTNPIRLYKSLGFALQRTPDFLGVRTPRIPQ